MSDPLMERIVRLFPYGAHRLEGRWYKTLPDGTRKSGIGSGVEYLDHEGIRAAVERKPCGTCGGDNVYREGTVGPQTVGMEPRGRVYRCPNCTDGYTVDEPELERMLEADRPAGSGGDDG